MALTWEYYPSSLMTNGEDDGLARLWLEQPAVQEKRGHAVTGEGGEWPVSSATCLMGSDGNKLWEKTSCSKKRGGIHR